MIDSIVWIGDSYGAWWLWFYAGALGPVWPLMLLAVVIPVVLFSIVMVIANPAFTAAQNPSLSASVVSWAAYLMVLPTVLVCVFLAMILGINGLESYSENFVECVQMDEVTSVSEQTVWSRYCRTREHVGDTFNEWKYDGSVFREYTTTPKVDNLP